MPRYNDYPEGELDIELMSATNSESFLGETIQARIVGFYGYADLHQHWRPADGSATARGSSRRSVTTRPGAPGTPR